MRKKDESKGALLKEIKALHERLMKLDSEETRRKRESERIEIERKRTEAIFRGLLESAPDAVVAVDRRGHIILVNAQTERWFGYNRDELIGQSVEILVPERLRKAHVQHRRRYLSQPCVRPMGAIWDLYVRRRDGSEFPVEISLGPLQTEEGTLVIGIIRDITEQKRTQEKLQKARIAEERLEAIRTLSVTCAHHLFNALVPVKSFAEILVKKTDPAAPTYRLTRGILDGTEKVVEIVHKLKEIDAERTITLGGGQIGESHPDVERLAAYLEPAGYLRRGVRDGDQMLGPNLSTALRRYQAYRGLPVTGMIDDATLQDLNSVVRFDPEPDVPFGAELGELGVTESFVAAGTKWGTLRLRYSFTNTSPDVTAEQQRAACRCALKL